MKCFFPLLLIVSSFSIIQAQPVSKNVIVEHFTNTYCSVCASRNPGFYANLSQHPQVLHIAYHPSAPYPSCPLNQHNKPENDDRTNFYSVYGSTPRIIIQGTVIPASSNYNDATLFQSQLGQNTPFDVGISIQLVSANSIMIRTVIKKVDVSPMTSLQLFAAMVEDTLFFNANNGETHHYDVFRMAVWGATGMSIPAPASVGDSTIYIQTINANTAWNLGRIYGVTILQDGNKNVIQAQKSNSLPSTLQIANNSGYRSANLSPNPAVSEIMVSLPETGTYQVRISDTKGVLLNSQTFQNEAIIVNIHNLNAGLYYMSIVTTDNAYHQTFIKQ